MSSSAEVTRVDPLTLCRLPASAAGPTDVARRIVIMDLTLDGPVRCYQVEGDASSTRITLRYEPVRALVADGPRQFTADRMPNLDDLVLHR